MIQWNKWWYKASLPAWVCGNILWWMDEAFCISELMFTIITYIHNFFFFKVASINTTMNVFREWRHFTYPPRAIRFSRQSVSSPQGKDVTGGIDLPQFSAATVPKVHDNGPNFLKWFSNFCLPSIYRVPQIVVCETWTIFTSLDSLFSTFRTDAEWPTKWEHAMSGTKVCSLVLWYICLRKSFFFSLVFVDFPLSFCCECCQWGIIGIQ